MKHCTDETLARLVDELPDSESRAHLENCVTCRHRLDALRKQTKLLAALPDPAVPADSWMRIASELSRQDETDVPVERIHSIAAGWRSPAFMRVAAVLIFLAGGASGAILTQALFTTRSSTPSSDATRGLEETGNSGVVSRQVVEDGTNADELVRYLSDTPNALQRDLVLRLSALEGVVMTTELAVRQAPGDLTLAAYHAAALRRRAALWQQLARGSGERWY